MLIKIRHSVFETNSSSCHTLSFKRRPTFKLQAEFEPEDNTIAVYGGMYGWGYDILDTWVDKLNYLAIEAADNPEYDALLHEALAKYFNKPVHIQYVIDEDAYIDHQSQGNIWNNIQQENIDVHQVLFDPTVTIRIGNDNG